MATIVGNNDLLLSSPNLYSQCRQCTRKSRKRPSGRTCLCRTLRTDPMRSDRLMGFVGSTHAMMLHEKHLCCEYSQHCIQIQRAIGQLPQSPLSGQGRTAATLQCMKARARSCWTGATRFVRTTALLVYKELIPGLAMEMMAPGLMMARWMLLGSVSEEQRRE